jgi:EF-hand domain pair
MFPLTAGLGALSYLTSLLQSSTANVSPSQNNNPLSLLGHAFGTDSQTQTASVGTGGTLPPFDPGMLASLISLQGQQSNGTNGASGLFAKLDTDGDGKISQTEFESALAADGVDTQSADALFSKLDANGDGSISQSELAAAHHGGHRHGGGMQAGLSSLLNGTDATGATTQTATNADGSTTTTITYADGSTVSMTAPAASTASNGGSSQSGSATPSQSNLLEQLIQLQSQFVAQQASSLSTLA